MEGQQQEDQEASAADEAQREAGARRDEGSGYWPRHGIVRRSPEEIERGEAPACVPAAGAVSAGNPRRACQNRAMSMSTTDASVAKAAYVDARSRYLNAQAGVGFLGGAADACDASVLGSLQRAQDAALADAAIRGAEPAAWLLRTASPAWIAVDQAGSGPVALDVGCWAGRSRAAAGRGHEGPQ
uniref:hypothetical protein n=1 Tax=Amycolatopsis sp. CA-096443 TaxID=3239919 RepID=UPI003F4927A7